MKTKQRKIEVMQKILKTIEADFTDNPDGVIELQWEMDEAYLKTSEGFTKMYEYDPMVAPDENTPILGWNGGKPEQPPMYYSLGNFSGRRLKVLDPISKTEKTVEHWEVL